MRKFKFIVGLILLFVVLAIAAAGFVQYYHLLFARKVTGEVISVQKVDSSIDVVAARPDERIASRLFSYAVAVEDEKTKEILVASSEDRRWATVEKGNCV